MILRALGIVRRLLARLPRHALREVAIFGFFVAVSIAMTWPYAIRLRTRLPDVGIDDPLLYARFSFNVHEFLLGRRSGLFDFDFFFPSLLVGTTNDPALGVAALTFPLRLFTDDYLLMVNLATLASFPLTAHATYVLTRRLTRSRGAGIVAGVAFAFCFFRIAQLDHVNVLQTAWLPYALAAIVRYCEAPSRRSQIFLALALFAAGAGSHNLALYGALVVPTFAIFALAAVRRKSRWRVALGMIAPGLVAALLLIPLYAPYRLAQGAWLPTRELWEVLQYSGKLEHLYAAPASSALYSAQSRLAGVESPMFPGFVVIGLAAIAVVWPGRATSRLRYAMFAIGAIYLLLCLGPEIRLRDRVIAKGAWHLLLELPGYASVRTPARFYFVTCLALAVLAGCGAAQLASWARRIFVPLGALPAPILAVLTLYELRAAPIPMHRIVNQAQAPAVYMALAREPEPGAVLGLPLHWSRELRPRMLHSIVHGRPTVDGISAFSLRYFFALEDPRLTTPMGEQALREAHAAGLRYVVLYLAELNAEQRERYTRFVERFGARSIGTYERHQIFQLPPSPSAVPLSPERVTVAVEDIGAAGRPPRTNASLDVKISSRAAEFIYERRVRKLSLLVVGVSGERLAEVPVVLAPPLYAPGAAWTERRHFRVPLPEGTHTIGWALRGESNERFGDGQVPIVVHPLEPAL